METASRLLQPLRPRLCRSIDERARPRIHESSAASREWWTRPRNSASRAAAGCPLQLAVALALELEEAEAVAEGIVQQCEAAVELLSRRCLENGTCRDGARNGCIEVIDDEVQVQGRPVPRVGAKLFGAFEGRAARRFEQQIDWSVCPQQLDEPAIETP